MSDFQLRRLGPVMEPEPGNPHEAEGVLNPAAARGPDGQLYLFPRLVARGNYSRIGMARVLFNEVGDPAGVKRLGIALEPEAAYELRHDGTGGCEDPRITFVEPLRRYVMTYTAHSADGPRIALAMSEDLFRWQRLGLATFQPYEDTAFEGVDNKDASVFPVAIPDPSGQPSMAILQRPLFPGTRPEETACHPASRLVDLDRESIWISYCSTAIADCEPFHLSHFGSHHRLAYPSGALGTAQDRRRYSTHPDPAPLADNLPRCQRAFGSFGVRPPAVLLGRGAGAFGGTSTSHSLSFAGASAGTGVAAGTRGHRRQRRVSHRHRSARRSRITGSLRHILWDGRQSDWRGETRYAGASAARGTCRPATSEGLKNSYRR
jgi:hypothetical protein